MTQPDRLTPGDMVVLATDVGPAPAQTGLLLDLSRTGLDTRALLAALEARLSANPVFRERLLRLPPFLGRPLWVEDDAFDVHRHLHLLRLDVPGERARLDVVADRLGRRLPLTRPPWAFTVLTQPDGHLAVLAILHHVVADGVRGLALLATLLDSESPHTNDTDGKPISGSTRIRPPRSALFRDALADHARQVAAVRHLGRALPAWRSTPGQTTAGASNRARTAPRTSLNLPTGPSRRLTVSACPLQPVRDAARRAGGTVNDVLLVALTTGLAAELAHRGEHPDHLVVSVPMVVPGQTRAHGLLGNATSVMAVRVPLHGSFNQRLADVVATTRDLKSRPSGGAVVLLGPVFRLLAGAGLFHSLIDSQHLVNTFLSNLRGPTEPVSVAGHTVERLVPMAATAGNVGASLFALSYADALTLSLVHDPGLLPDGTRVMAGVTKALGSTGSR